MTLRSMTTASRTTVLRTVLSRLIALTACAAMTMSAAACSSPDDRSDEQQTAQSATGTVAIFTPSDGVTISGNTPLNKWTRFVPALTAALRKEGIAKKNISTSSADSLDKQSHDIQDFVVDRVSSSDSSSSQNGDDAQATQTAAVTLVVAPVNDADDTVRQYGDYVSQSIEAGSSTSGTADAQDGEASTRREAINRLVSALRLARDNGMHVVMLSNTIDDIQPDLYVRMSTAESIGKVQAQKLVSKLDLDTVSKDNPKSIEVLLPVTSRSSQDGGVGSVLGLIPSTDNKSQDDPTETSAAFAKAAFKGLWSVLKPYFTSGKAVSPSGMLTADTTDDDWENVTFFCAKDDDVRDALRDRLGMTSHSDAHTRIDGIIAMNDFVASGVVKELDDLGYTGSAADINPSITISGIVENITGKKDLQREKVPDPIKAPDDSDGTNGNGTTTGKSDSKTVEQVNAKWPIVTGYGAYTDIMPQIVSGQQWMTALEDRLSVAEDTAKACTVLNAGGELKPTDIPSLVSSKVNGKATPTISEEPLAVSAYNLKDALIDPGYITLADAGL